MKCRTKTFACVLIAGAVLLPSSAPAGEMQARIADALAAPVTFTGTTGTLRTDVEPGTVQDRLAARIAGTVQEQGTQTGPTGTDQRPRPPVRRAPMHVALVAAITGDAAR